MDILIIESETYLAASLAAKLEASGHTCTIGLPNVKYDEHFQVLLLGSFFDTLKIIKEHSNSVIILLANYINSDITQALNAGASDYILKPVIIEELKRKIDFYTEFKRIKLLNDSYEGILDAQCQNKAFNTKEILKLRLPLQIISNNLQNSDIFVYLFSKLRKISFIRYNGNLAILKSNFDLLYFSCFDELSAKEKESILASKNKKIIIRSEEKLPNFTHYEIMNKEKISLMSVDEYIKFCINEQQDIYNDTQLSQILGISRKSLWEKRRRYGIAKDK